MSKSAIAARVGYCGHDGWFLADIFTVGNVNVVRANGKVDYKRLHKPMDVDGGPTHHLSDMPEAGFWRPDLGVFVVPVDQVTEVV